MNVRKQIAASDEPKIDIGDMLILLFRVVEVNFNLYKSIFVTLHMDLIIWSTRTRSPLISQTSRSIIASWMRIEILGVVFAQTLATLEQALIRSSN